MITIMLFEALVVFSSLQFCICTPHWRTGERIIGGGAAEAHSVKSMVYIDVNINDPKHPDLGEVCGGTLISEQHVLTAAHCVDGAQTIDALVLGAHNVSDEDEPTITVAFPLKVQKHPDWDRNTGANDIAVVKLRKKVALNNYVQLADLEPESSKSETYNGKTATAYGWGLIHKDQKQEAPDVLQKVDLKISGLACQNIGISGVICTSGNGKKGTCNGDSGGPLLLDGVQIGVVSRGNSRFCERGEASIYTRVAAFRSWIDDQVKTL